MTRAVAAVPWLFVSGCDVVTWGRTYGMLHSCYKNLLGVESLAMLPEYPGDSNCMLRAHRAREGREMAIRPTCFVIGLLRILVHGKWTMEKNESRVVLLVEEEKGERRCIYICRCPTKRVW